ncbi:MAG: hypothetical protein HZB56_12375 [Deltaproteobacteria bacterium]|nr:hypothetical protein [Deltaproteobacteria bacterium]
MKKLAAILTTALLAAAGCSDTCSTKSAPLDAAGSPTCTSISSAGATATAPLCQRCTDTNPTCQVEVVANTIQINSTLKECDSNRGCGDPSCANPRPAVSCAVPVLTPGTYTVQFIGGSGMVQYTATVGAGGNSTCSL